MGEVLLLGKRSCSMGEVLLVGRWSCNIGEVLLEGPVVWGKFMLVWEEVLLVWRCSMQACLASQHTESIILCYFIALHVTIPRPCHIYDNINLSGLMKTLLNYWVSP